MKQENLFATASKEEALTLLEITRAEYLESARNVAHRLAVAGDGTCTVDDVRAELPPPKEIDGRVMGAIFNRSDWEHSGYESSKRMTCHKRPISRFRLKGTSHRLLSKG